jgi:NIMA (never in mitosis gene a)-related kinase
MNSKYILHRDIKTANIFIHADGILKVGDFGISRELQSSLDKVNTAAGTPYFMAPEVVAYTPYDSKADMWSLGVIIYELISLEKPFEAKSVQEVIHVI